MNLKELYLRLKKGQKVPSVREEFSAFVENYRKKKKLLDELHDGDISETDFREKFRPLLDVDDVLLSLEQKLIKRFPNSDELKMDLGVLRANLETQKKIINLPVEVSPFHQDRLRAAVSQQAYAFVEEEEHKRDELEKESEKPLPEKEGEPSESKPEAAKLKLVKKAEAEPTSVAEAPAIWQHPSEFFGDDPWFKPQAALDFFKDVIWELHRVLVEPNYAEYEIKTSMQAWANQHLLATFPNVELFADTILWLAKQCKRRRLGDVILALRGIPEPVNLKKLSLSRQMFANKWVATSKAMKKLPAEVQALLNSPVDILDKFTEFLKTAEPGVEPVVVMQTPTLEEHEPDSQLKIISERDETFEEQRAAAERAAKFLVVVGRSVVTLIDNPDNMPQVMKYVKRAPEIDDPGEFFQNMAAIARENSDKKNRQAWVDLMVSSVDLQGLFKKLPEKVGFWNRGSHKNLRTLVAKMEGALADSGALIHDFIKQPYIAIKKVHDTVLIKKKVKAA